MATKIVKPRVSILMGAYNCASTLEEAIDSIIVQTYTDWELIICDDGSSDLTYDVAQSYQRKIPDKIILIKNRCNQGLNKTLNHCLEHARGEYVARMDGDDISMPKRLEMEVAFLDTHPEYAIVSCPMIYFDENGDWGRGVRCGEVKKTDFIRGTPFCHAPCMVHKDAYDSVGGYSTDPRTLRAEDYDLWFRMYEKGYRGYNLSEPLYKMRDDYNAFRRRKFRYALNEAYVRWNGYKMLGFPTYLWLYAARPIVVGLLPKPIYVKLHHKKKNGIFQ